MKSHCVCQEKYIECMYNHPEGRLAQESLSLWHVPHSGQSQEVNTT